jgi:hypothetical protein
MPSGFKGVHGQPYQRAQGVCRAGMPPRRRSVFVASTLGAVVSPVSDPAATLFRAARSCRACGGGVTAASARRGCGGALREAITYHRWCCSYDGVGGLLAQLGWNHAGRPVIHAPSRLSALSLTLGLGTYVRHIHPCVSVKSVSVKRRCGGDAWPVRAMVGDHRAVCEDQQRHLQHTPYSNRQ